MQYKSTRVTEGQVLPLDDREVDIYKALMLLLFCDLEFGGVITTSQPAGKDWSIKTQSGVFGSIDYNEFVGTDKELAPIINIHKYITRGQFSKYKLGISRGGSVLGATSMHGDVLNRTQALKAMLLHAMGVRDYPEALLKKPWEDLLSGLELRTEEYCTDKDFYILLGVAV